MEYKHVPVMLGECMDGLNIKPDGVYLDGTLGGGGHSLEIVKRLNGGRLIANDLDLEAIAAAKNRLNEYNDKITYIHGNYKNLSNKIDCNPDGILLDLGVSSYQIDNAERGFSYMTDAPLDMRMDRESALTAAKVVNTYPHPALAKVIRDYGEEDNALKIATAIIKARAIKPIETTLELAEIIEKALPPKIRYQHGHPAKKTFQAIRIEVNGELSGLYEAIVDLAKTLKAGGRMCVITFHSLEDRAVKNAFKWLELDCVCDKKAPICTCDKVKEIKLINNKPITAKTEELESNSRAASAKLRIIERL